MNPWYWETWNEANSQPKGYRGGSMEDFLKLHDYAIDGVRRPCPRPRWRAALGRPRRRVHAAFLEHALQGTNFATGESGTPLDFVAFHAKAASTFVDGHVRMGIAAQLATIETAFGIFASFPELKSTPVVIGESDPEAFAACQGPHPTATGRSTRATRRRASRGSMIWPTSMRQRLTAR